MRMANELQVPIYNLKRQKAKDILAGFDRIEKLQKLNLPAKEEKPERDRSPGE